MANTLANRVAIVTGGAKGIGYAIARSLGQAGAKVMLADWDKPAVEEAASSLTKDGIQAACTQCDVSNSQQVTELVARTASEMGGVDIMVANAGGQVSNPVHIGYTLAGPSHATPKRPIKTPWPHTCCFNAVTAATARPT